MGWRLDERGVTERVYRAMLEQPAASTEELATLLELPPLVVQEELERLHELALVHVWPDGAAAYVARSPERAIELLLSREEMRIAEAQAGMRQARELALSLAAIFEGHTRRDRLGFVERIDDAAGVSARVFQLVSEARRDLDVMVSGLPGPVPCLIGTNGFDIASLARHLSVRVVVPQRPDESPGTSAATVEVLGPSTIRFLPELPLSAVLVDGEAALLPCGPASALVVRGSELVRPVAALFEYVWAGAMCVDEGICSDQLAASERRIRQIIGLLAHGYKDEAIARRLGVSVRTVRRLVSAALDHLGAESRFQAGVLAAQRGLT